MIHNLFPTRVLINDDCLSADQLTELSLAINVVFAMHEAVTGSHVVTGEDSMPLFTDENMKNFPVISDLKNVFLEGFNELAQSDPNNALTSDEIEHMFNLHSGRLPIMREGDYKKLHAHPGTTAFGVFYMSDVDNEKDGGKLILRDPSFHVNPGYRSDMTHEIETRAGRLIIAPSYIWHEVTPYYGKEDRLTAVSNLSYLTDSLKRL
jgi:hypothetical protein